MDAQPPPPPDPCLPLCMAHGFVRIMRKLITVSPTKAGVTLKGLSRDLKLLNPLSLGVVLDLTDAQPGPQRITISEEHLRVPGAIQLDRIDPPFIDIELAQQRQEVKGLLGTFGGGGTQDQPAGAGTKLTDGAPQAVD